MIVRSRYGNIRLSLSDNFVHFEKMRITTRQLNSDSTDYLLFALLQRIIKIADKDNSGTLSYEEFIQAVTD